MTFISILKGKASETVPLWFMRQAGRCLPEYRDLREKAGSFWTMCLNPEFTVEATLQPLRRFDIDAAILFSDILMIPYGLGQKIEMIESKGPSLDVSFLQRFENPDLDRALETWQPIFESIRKIKKELKPDKVLIGFAGGPWTVACYMIEGIKTKDHSSIKKQAYWNPVWMDSFIKTLTKTTKVYLREQILAGVDAIQLFESWAGILPDPYFKRWVLAPLLEIARDIRQEFPAIPLIVFPKGASAFYDYFVNAKIFNGINLDHDISFEKVRKKFESKIVFQGGLDPQFLAVGGAEMDSEIRRLLNIFKGTPYIFNLSHGIVPETPVENIARAIRLVKGSGA